MANEDDLLRRIINEVEGRSTQRGNTPDIAKDVTFNGVDNYPKEFLRELKEIKELYYNSEDIKWIGRHLV